MKILAIEGENIASLAGFRLDLQAEPLRSSGLFAIVGPTGSGKSSLLDAMCLALFQQAPRLDNLFDRDAKVPGTYGELAQNNVRNLLRRGTTTAWAACEFLGRDGEAYRARWGYRAPKRKGSASQEELGLERLSDGQVLVSGNNRKGEFAERITDLLGLTYAQFTRTVLLAQGRFAEFLRAPEDERARLLEKLTGTEIYAEVSRAVFERARDEMSVVRELEGQMAGIERLGDAETERLLSRRQALEDRRGPDARELENLTEIVRLLRAHLEGVRALEEAAVRAQGRRGEAETARGALDAERARRDVARAALEAAQDSLREADRLDAELAFHREHHRRHDEEARAAQRLREQADQDRQEALVWREEAQADQAKDTVWLEARERLRPVADEWARVRLLLEQAGRARDAAGELGARRRRDEEALEACEEPLRVLIAEIDAFRARLGGISPEEIPVRLRRTRALLEDLGRERDRLLLDAELVEVDGALQALGSELSGVDGRIPSLRTAVEVAREFADAARLAASGNVVHLRSTLRPGEPCPVCGAQEHSLTSEADERLRDLLQGHVASLRIREEELSSAQRELETLLERRRGVLSRRAGLAQRRESLGEAPPDLDLAQDGDAVARLADVESRRLGAEVDLGLLEQAEEAANEIARRAEQAAHLRTLRAEHEAALSAGLERLAELEAESLRTGGALDGHFGSPAWRERWELDPQRYLDGLEKQVGEWQATLERTLRRAQDLDRSLDRLGTLEAACERARSQVEQSLERLDASTRQILSLEGARGALFGGRPVPEVRASLEGPLAAAETALETARDRSEAQALELAASVAELEGLAGAQRSMEEGIARLVPLIPVDRAPSWSPPSTLEVLPAWEAVRSEKARALEAVVQELAEVRARLVSDAEAGEKLDQFVRRLEERRVVQERWARLSAEVGSADGRKFCVLAQQFTLERLLQRAEIELSRLSPRYGLRRLGESMSFGVLDRDSWDELRPVHTLSGGETFLVSLALALSLSSLSGSAVDVGTLFIDEGFGTLDGETLRQVMDALSNLQAQGRQVGLITHVEELKELIPVRVEVVRTGPGTSTVRVR